MTTRTLKGIVIALSLFLALSLYTDSQVQTRLDQADDNLNRADSLQREVYKLGGEISALQDEVIEREYELEELTGE